MLQKPLVSAGHHPVETQNYTNLTPTIASLCGYLTDWLRNKVPGAIVYGPQRFGKTRAIRFISKFIESEYPGLPVFEFLANEYSKASERVFFEDILRSIGHSIVVKGRPSDKRYRAYEFLRETAEMNPWSKIVFLIDDAQRLHEQHYKWLMDIHNALDQKQLHMSCFLVGQTDLKHQKSSFAAAKKQQIIGRLMVHEFQFHGIQSVKDMAFCLGTYDDHSEFPLQSGWSFTKYYFPRAFDSGWRLKGLAESFWEAYALIHIENKFPSLKEIPMQYFCRSVEWLLTRRSEDDETYPRITEACLRESIIRSGYVDVYLENEL